jgi:hypothetical protein
VGVADTATAAPAAHSATAKRIAVILRFIVLFLLIIVLFLLFFVVRAGGRRGLLRRPAFV